jgi:prepilin-type N-terminal cleavage/methylation domain-containing protein
MKKNKAFSLVELSVVILIIGILVAGVTQSGRLIRQIKLSTARSVTASSDVASIRDVTAWFEASTDGIFIDINGVTDVENNAQIATWNDINPQKPKGDRPVLSAPSAVADGGKKPKYITNGINGIPSVYFDGDDHVFTDDGPKMPLISGDKTYSMFAVFRADLNSVKTKSIITQIGSGSTLEDNKFVSIGFIGDTTNNGQPGFITNGTKNNNWIRNVAINDQTDYIVGVLADLTPTTIAQSSATIYVNSLTPLSTEEGTDNEFPSGGTYSSTDIDAKKFTIGANAKAAANVNEFFKGMVSEVIVFDRKLKDEEAQSVMKYLRKKYNILN